MRIAIIDTSTTRAAIISDGLREAGLHDLVLIDPAGPLVAQIEGLKVKPDDLGAETGKALGRLFAAIGRAGLKPSGPPRVIYAAWSPHEVAFTVAAPIDRLPASPLADGVGTTTLPGVVALRFIHHGPYREIRTTYDRIEAWLRERGGIRTPADWARYSPMWEEYMNDPSTTPESDLETRIFLKLRDA